MIAQIADHPSAHLEALFNHDAQTFNRGPGGFHNGNQPLEGTAVGQKIVDDQHMILRTQEFLGDHHLIAVFVGEGFNLRHIHVAFNVDGLGLLGEHHGNAELPGHKTGDADAGSFDGQHLGDLLV